MTLPVNVAPGDPGHAGLHNDVNAAVNALNNGMGSAAGILSGAINVAYDRVILAAQSPGGVSGIDVDLYTVPSGKRAIFTLTSWSQSLTTISLFQEVKIAGVYYHLAAVQSPPSKTFANANFGMVFEAGDIVAVNLFGTALVLTAVAVVGAVVTYTGTITNGAASAYAGKSFAIEGFVNGGNNLTFTVVSSTTTTLVGVTSTQVNETHTGTAVEQTGYNFFAMVTLFDDTSPIKSARNAATVWINGENLIYTCPLDKHASTVGFTALLNSSTAAGTAHVNQSGSAAIISISIVTNGDSPTINNRFTTSASLANNAVLAPANPMFYFAPGDSISVNTNQVGKQLTWINIFEQ